MQNDRRRSENPQIFYINMLYLSLLDSDLIHFISAQPLRVIGGKKKYLERKRREWRWWTVIEHSDLFVIALAVEQRSEVNATCGYVPL